MTEDSSVLKVRSDLYPHAAFTPPGAMTSTTAMTPPNNPSSGTTPTDDSSESTPALTTLSPHPTSMTTTTTTTTTTTPPELVPLASEGDTRAAPSWKDHDPWRKQNKECLVLEGSVNPLSFREESVTSRSRAWTASSEPIYTRHDNAKSASEQDATPPMTPSDSDDVQDVTLSYGDARSSSSATVSKVTDDQQVPGRSPSLYPIPLVKGQSPQVFPHSMSFQAAPPTPSGGDTSRPPPTPPDEAPLYVAVHPSPSASRPESKYSNSSPRTEGQSSGDGCRGTLDLSTSSRSTDVFPQQAPQLVSSPSASPSPFSPFGIFPGLARFHEMNPMFREGFDAAVQKPPYNSPLYAANLHPQLLPWLISSQLQNLVQHQQASSTDGKRSNIFGECKGGFLVEDKDQQPLDLSAKKRDSKPLIDEDLVARVLDIKPSTRGRRRADNRRSYTENELLAALRDIQSGKLGTRRAAVIYGIPRSTLRNKVYKLQSNREQAKKGIDPKEKSQSALPDSTAHLRSPIMLSKATDAESPVEVPCEELKTILKKRMTEKLEELSRNSQTSLSGWDKQKLLDSALTYLCDNIPKLALNTDNKTTTSEIHSSLSLYPQLQELTHKIVENRFYEEIKKINNNIDDNVIPEIANGYKSECINPPINIPSYPSIYKSQTNDQSMRSEERKSDSSHPPIGSPPQTNLKDMIAQIINQKILSDSVPTDLSYSNYSSTHPLPMSVQCMDPSSIKSGLKYSTDEKPQHEQAKKRSKSPSSSGGGKGSRPKRGKYRNYDRDNLLKAVQAVQSGEMSVHRAGSFYGVPHSTLEYKVKERHLNRGRNKKDAGVLSNVSLLKSGKENTSSSAQLASTAFTMDQFSNDTSDVATKDLSSAVESRSSDEISIISVQSPPAKKSKLSPEPDEPFSSLPISSNPFLSNTFPFWNNASSILAPFLSSSYQAEQLYASQVMSNFQRAASKMSNSDPRTDSPPSDTNHSEPFSVEGASRPLGLFPNGGPSSTPPSSPTTSHDGLLNTLLQKKMKTHMSESSISWPIPPSDTSTEEDTKERNSEQESVVIPPAGLFTLKALLPSFIAARNPLAAAFSADTNHLNTSRIPSSSSPPTSLPLLKGTSHIPVVGGGTSLSETP